MKLIYIEITNACFDKIDMQVNGIRHENVNPEVSGIMSPILEGPVIMGVEDIEAGIIMNLFRESKYMDV